jgi:uncharacterized cupin superfamily protein
MSEPEVKSLETPEETRPFLQKGSVAISTLGTGTVGRATCEPGWRWSTDVGALSGTTICRVNHLGYVVSGRMGIEMEDGTQVEAGPGDAFVIPPGHDAWVIGEETCVWVDFAGMETYAT